MFELISFFYLSRIVTEKPHQGSVNRLLYCIESFVIVLKPFSEPSGPPVKVSARNLSSTSILVQWGEVPDTDKNGIILSYTVNFKVTPEGNLQQSQVVNASTREVTLTGLNKNTKYEIQVFANTSKGGGQKSQPITVQTDEDSKCTIAEVTAAAFMGRASNRRFL